MEIISKNVLEAYGQIFKHLAKGGDLVSTTDKELFAEAVGLIVIEKPESPLKITENKILGEYNYEEYLKNSNVIYQEVKNSYEKDLLLSGKLNKVIEFIKSYPESKRAVLDIWSDEEHPCVVYLWFRINNSKLNCHVHMRANDVYKKLLMNLHIFIAIQKSIAKTLQIDIGAYYHFGDSFHFRTEDRQNIETKKLQSLQF